MHFRLTLHVELRHLRGDRPCQRSSLRRGHPNARLGPDAVTYDHDIVQSWLPATCCHRMFVHAVRHYGNRHRLERGARP